MSIDVKQNHSEEYWLSIFALVGYQVAVWIVSAISMALLTTFKVVHSIPVGNPFYLLSILLSKNVLVLSISGMIAINRRLNLLNKCLEAEISKMSTHNLKTLIILHDKLCDAIALVNECFSLQFMLIIFAYVFRITLLIFNLFHIFMNDPKELIFWLSGVLFVLPEVAFLGAIILQSSLLKKKAHESLTLIHRLKFIRNVTKKTLKLVQLAYLQINHRNPAISCGLFIIDDSFLFITIAGSFSYVIILIQFAVAGSF